MKRKKRLQKGIKTLEETIKIHEDRKKKAKEIGDELLEKYLDKEIEKLKERVLERKDKLDR